MPGTHREGPLDAQAVHPGGWLQLLLEEGEGGDASEEEKEECLLTEVERFWFPGGLLTASSASP